MNPCPLCNGYGVLKKGYTYQDSPVVHTRPCPVCEEISQLKGLIQQRNQYIAELLGEQGAYGDGDPVKYTTVEQDDYD